MKLYSQIKDPRFHGRKLLTEFVAAGAPEDILWQAKPHIGTFRLVTMVENMRAKIEALGGSYRFDTRLERLELERAADGRKRVAGLTLSTGETIAASHVMLAVGHSARETFAMLHRAGVAMEAKPSRSVSGWSTRSRSSTAPDSGQRPGHAARCRHLQTRPPLPNGRSCLLASACAPADGRGGDREPAGWSPTA